MKLQQREIVTIGAGVLILIVALLFGLKGRGASANGTLDDGLARINEFNRLQESVAKLRAELKIDTPDSSAGDQNTAIMDDLSARARDHDIKVGSLKPITSSAKARPGSVRTVQFRIELSGRFDSLIQFINGLETARVPYILKEVHIDSETRAARDAAANEAGSPEEDLGPPPPGNGRVRAALKIQSYIFPDAASVR